MKNYLGLAVTDANRARQADRGSLDLYDTAAPGPDAIDPFEMAFIGARDSFYMATVNEDGWPYVQHRGGDIGFVRQLGPTTIGWVERSGNRQYLGTGNLAANDKVSIIFMNYADRQRLKLLGRATVHADPSPELIAALGAEGVRIDGAVTVEIDATAWNCPKYITPRFTEAEVERAVVQLTDRIAELEAQLAAAVS